MVSYAGYHEEDIQNGAINQVDVLFVSTLQFQLDRGSLLLTTTA